MNRRWIRKILAKKHKDFVTSITDEKVRRLVKENSIITGGSIVSLLNNEPEFKITPLYLVSIIDKIFS